MPTKTLAIISVSDKTGLDRIARVLAGLGVWIVSTSGTAAYLREHGLYVSEISDLAAMPEMLSGRVKALHPAVFAGILARPQDAAEMAQHGYARVGYLIAGIPELSPGAPDLAGMDIGGPAMIRAAVKNHENVVLATHSSEYSGIVEALETSGAVGGEMRRRLAHKAIVRLQKYESDIEAYLAGSPGPVAPPSRWDRAVPLRYGENPHQSATLYVAADAAAGAAQARQLQGKDPSYTNILDADVAFALACRFGRPAAAVVKHGAPCGVALGDSLAEAYERALAADPQSAFGSTVGLNGQVDAHCADSILRQFTEVIIAPGYTAAAVEAAKRRPSTRLLETDALAGVVVGMELRSVAGGLLAQSPDSLPLDPEKFECVTKRQPTAAELADLIFALEVSRFVKSNAVVTASNGATLGIGGGQSSRVGAVELALRPVAKADMAGAVLASDAYFPFPDCIDLAAVRGISAIVQQGGAKRDVEVIAAADAAGIAMLFSHLRLFRH